MPVVVVARADDEIADLIERVRSAKDPDVGLVIPPSSRALQTPLNARLLAQFSRQSGRRTAIVTDDRRIQELARANGFTIYGSVPAFERGIELAPPRLAGAVQVPEGAAAGAGAAAATAVLDAPPAPAPAPVPTAPVYTPVAARVEPRRVLAQIPPPRPPARDRRRVLYFAAAAVAVIGLLLFLTLTPSAKITVTIAATPLSVNKTIQGATDPTLSTGTDKIATAVVTSTGQNQFQATPTGTTTLPATAAKTTVVFSTNYQHGLGFNLPQGNVIQSADGTISFAVSQDTFICIGPEGAPPPSGSCTNMATGQAEPPNPNAPVQDATPEAKGNVAANTLTTWPSDPCPATVYCPGPNVTITVTNPSAATGGADAKHVTAASNSDVSNWNNQVTQIEAQITSQVSADLQSKAAGKSFAVDPTGGGKTVAFTVAPALPAAGSQYSPTQITITANAQATIYDPVAVRNDLIADLNKMVTQGDELAPGKYTQQPCSVTLASTDGTLNLACSATDYSQPIINLDTIKSQLTGKNPSDAQRLIERAVSHVQTVQVSESPFQLFYLPFFASRIEIDENFVALPSPTS